MIGYAPFLGQVRLVRSPYSGFALGQEGIPPTGAPTDPEGFMPYNGLLFSQVLKWASACTTNAPAALSLAARFEQQYFGNKEVFPEMQTPIRLSDAERTLVNGAKDCVSRSCIQIGTVKSWMMDETLRLREGVEVAAGRTIVRIPTGRIFSEGSRSEAHEMMVWSCPGAPPAAGTGTQGLEPPVAAPSKFPVAPVVGGLAATGLLAYLLFG